MEKFNEVLEKFDWVEVEKYPNFGVYEKLNWWDCRFLLKVIGENKDLSCLKYSEIKKTFIELAEVRVKKDLKYIKEKEKQKEDYILMAKKDLKRYVLRVKKTIKVLDDLIEKHDGEIKE